MSKERRRLRAEREAAPAPARGGRRPAAGRSSADRPGARKPARRRGRPPARRRRSPLAAQRRSQNLALAAGLLTANLLLWTQVHGWGARLVALVLTVALWPVVVTVVFDRKSS